MRKSVVTIGGVCISSSWLHDGMVNTFAVLQMKNQPLHSQKRENNNVANYKSLYFDDGTVLSNNITPPREIETVIYSDPKYYLPIRKSGQIDSLKVLV